MIEKYKKYYGVVQFLFFGIVILMLNSCGGGENIGKNPYCEFVDGEYTFDIDLRRSMFFVGKDFEYDYYTSEMKECKVEDATYVRLKALGHYFDENIHEEEDVDVFYSSLMELPEENKVIDRTLNIFTTLETERIIYLMRSGYSYQESKDLVYKEIWEQLKESGFFAHYDFLNVQAFEELNIDDDCLKSVTSYFSKVILNAAMVVDDKTLCSTVLIDFVNNYATTGDLELHQFNQDVFSKVDSDIFTLSGEEMLLKYSVTYYNIPFDGGVPHIHKGGVYYGVDTSSFKKALSSSKNASLTLSWPRYESFTCNGYVDLQGMFVVDSLYTDKTVQIVVKDVEKNTIETTITLTKDSKNSLFAETVWLERQGRYEITISYGKEQISLNVNNLLDFSLQED